MEKFNELLSKLQELEIIQESGDWTEDIPESIWQEYFTGNFKTKANNLEIDSHRWYETSITVIEIYGRFLGIRYITQMFSESQGFEDCYVKIEFMEMKEVETITYEKAEK